MFKIKNLFKNWSTKLHVYIRVREGEFEKEG